MTVARLPLHCHVANDAPQVLRRGGTTGTFLAVVLGSALAAADEATSPSASADAEPVSEADAEPVAEEVIVVTGTRSETPRSASPIVSYYDAAVGAVGNDRAAMQDTAGRARRRSSPRCPSGMRSQSACRIR